MENAVEIWLFSKFLILGTFDAFESIFIFIFQVKDRIDRKYITITQTSAEQRLSNYINGTSLATIQGVPFSELTSDFLTRIYNIFMSNCIT